MDINRDQTVDNSETLWQPDAQTTTQDRPTVKPAKRLTAKQQAFIKHLLDNPTASAAAAYKVAYNTKGHNNTIYPEASRTANKPQVRAALEANAELFESVVVGTARDWGKSDNTRQRELALQASYWGHDKVHGKATQRTENVTTSVNLNLNLSDVVDNTDNK